MTEQEMKKKIKERIARLNFNINQMNKILPPDWTMWKPKTEEEQQSHTEGMIISCSIELAFLEGLLK